MTYHFFMNLFIPDHTFFANLLSACFKLWFHKTYNPAAVFQQIPYRDQYLGQRNKSNIYGGKVNRVGNIFRRNISYIRLFHGYYPLILTQFPSQLVCPYINSIHLNRTILQHAVGKTTGRRSYVHTQLVL